MSTFLNQVSLLLLNLSEASLMNVGDAQLLAGSLVGGTASYYLSSQIQAKTKQLSTDLHQLSTRLTTLSPVLSTPQSSGIQRLPLKEHVKSRWNESLIGALTSVRETRWDLVMVSMWGQAKAGYSIAKEKLTQEKS